MTIMGRQWLIIGAFMGMKLGEGWREDEVKESWDRGQTSQPISLMHPFHSSSRSPLGQSPQLPLGQEKFSQNYKDSKVGETVKVLRGHGIVPDPS